MRIRIRSPLAILAGDDAAGGMTYFLVNEDAGCISIAGIQTFHIGIASGESSPEAVPFTLISSF